jgi:hypothetical protein
MGYIDNLSWKVLEKGADTLSLIGVLKSSSYDYSDLSCYPELIRLF